MIYFIEAIGSECVKIGVSDTVEKRLTDLQCGCPHELKLLGTIHGGFGIEKILHRYLKRMRVRGEWFEKTDLISSIIKHNDTRHIFLKEAERGIGQITDGFCSACNAPSWVNGYCIFCWAFILYLDNLIYKRSPLCYQRAKAK